MRIVIGVMCASTVACGRVAFHDRTDAGSEDGGQVPSVFAAIRLPDGGRISNVVRAIDGTLYAVASGAHTLRSSDGGVSWTACGRNLFGSDELIADPTGTLYSLGSNGVSASSDGCASWQDLGLAQATDGMAVAGTTLFVGTSDGLYAWDGAQWTQRGLAGHVITDISLSPSQIYVATRDGLACSSDGGVTFPFCDSGLAALDGSFVVAEPSDPTHAFTQTSTGDSYYQYYTVDSGATWQPVPTQEGGFTLAVDPNDANFVLWDTWVYGIEASSDGGVNYDGTDHRSPEMDSTQANRLVLGPGSQVLSATDRGLFVATDHNLQWTEIDAGINAWEIDQIAIGGNGELYLATRSGVLRSVDDGATWTDEITGLGPLSETPSVAQVPNMSDTIITASDNAVRLSTDEGQNYSLLWSPGPADHYHALRIRLVGTTILAATRGGVVVSTDWMTFNHADLGGVSQLVDDVIALDDTATKLLAVADIGGVFYSSDGGFTWVATSNGLGDLRTYAEVVLPDGSLLVGTATGLYHAATPTNEWAASGLAGDEIDALLVTNGKVLAATTAGVFVSSDGAATWQLVPGLEDEFPNALAIDRNGDLLVGTYGFGLFRTSMP